ncbi:MAG: DUF3108 domain-containing protein [Endomicrobiaceae bacterium]
MIIRKIKIIFFLFLAAANICAADNNGKPAADENGVEVSTSSFKWRNLSGHLPAKENLVFDVYWQFIKVGQGTLEIRGFESISGRIAYHLYSQAKSSSFFDAFFKVRDINQSWFDAESLCSLRYSANISEGGWKKQEQVDFDHANKRFILNDNGSIKEGDTVLWVQDVISALYFFRTLDLEVGKEYIFDAHSGDKSWPLKTKVTGKETVETKAGKFNCLILEPAIRDNAGIFQAKGRLQVWVTDDENKMPVKMKTKIPVGSIIAELSEYNNLSDENLQGKSDAGKTN